MEITDHIQEHRRSEGQRTGIFVSLPRTKHMLLATLALPTVPSKVKMKPIGLAATEQETPHWKELYIFRAILKTPRNHLRRNAEVTV